MWEFCVAAPEPESRMYLAAAQLKVCTFGHYKAEACQTGFVVQVGATVR